MISIILLDNLAVYISANKIGNHTMYKLLMLSAAAWLLVGGTAFAAEGHGHVETLKHAEHDELAEPFFTKKSYPENEVEFEVGFGHGDAEDELEFGVGASIVFDGKFQIGVEIPYVVRKPDGAKDELNIGDIEFSAKYLVYRAPENRFILSLDAEVAVPTGNEDKDIGEKGEWGIFATAATAIPLGNGLSDLGVHLQFGYEQQIRTTKEQDEEAEELGVEAALEKAIIYRLAFTTKLANGRFQPSIEFLGTTVIDAIEDSEKGTIIEIGGGFWWFPFVGSNNDLAALALGIAAKGAVSKMHLENVYSTLFVVKYEF